VTQLIFENQEQLSRIIVWIP